MRIVPAAQISRSYELSLSCPSLLQGSVVVTLYNYLGQAPLITHSKQDASGLGLNPTTACIWTE